MNLSTEQKTRMRQRRAEGATLERLAWEFGVCVSYAHRIVRSVAFDTAPDPVARPEKRNRYERNCQRWDMGRAVV